MIFVYAGLALVGLVLLDRLLLGMEARGWIFYRRVKPQPRSVGSAFLEIQALAEPGARQVVEAKEERREIREDGDDGELQPKS